MDRLHNVFINKELNIRQVMEKIDENASKIALVVDDKTRLLGIITDGDIRRWILKSGSLNEKAYEIMNKEPMFLKEGFDISEARKIMNFKKASCIPVVNSENEVISAVWWEDFFEEKYKKHEKIQVPVVIMAGGKGTRLEPFTKVLPKALIPIGDKSILEIIINKFIEHGCEEFYLSINYKANIIKTYFSDITYKYKLNYLEEKEFYGTAGSLSLLKNKLKETFFINNCDIIIEADYADILKNHKLNGNVVTIVGSMKNFKIPYGVIEIDESGKLLDIKEKPEFNFLVNTGMYLIEPEVLKLIPENRVFHFTDLVGICLEKKMKVGIYPITEKAWTDIGQTEELFLTLKKFGIK